MDYDEHSEPGGGAPAEDKTLFALNRRDFIGGIGAGTLATAGFAQAGEDTDDVRVEFLRSVDPGSGVDFLDIVVLDRLIGDPEAPLRPRERFWRLRSDSFGPDARFLLDPPGLGREEVGPWELRVARVGYARLRGRDIRLTFRFRSLDTADHRGRRLTVAMTSTVWSSQSGATTQNPITFHASEPVAGLSPTEVVFRDLVDPKQESDAARFRMDVPVGRVTNTARLMFNGAIAATRGRWGDPDVIFARDLSWRVSAPEGQIAALGQRQPLTGLRIWRPNTQSPLTPAEARAAPLYGEATPEPEARLDGIEIGGGGGPVWSLKPARAGALRLRAQPPPPESDRARASVIETETVLDGEWSVERMAGQGAARRVGPLPKLTGFILERIEAPARASNVDYARRRGTVSFQARYTGGNEATTTQSPIGPLTTVALGETGSEDAGAASDFPERRGWPVQALWIWEPGLAGRDRPFARFMEASLAIVGSGLHPQGADHSRMDFADTELRVWYAQDRPDVPIQGSMIDLGAGSDDEVARLDLSRATMRVWRAHDLLSLTFRFSGLVLSFDAGGGVPQMLRADPRCEVTARPGLRGEVEVQDTRPGLRLRGEVDVQDTRPVMVVEFPPQHLFEEATFAPRPVDPPDVSLDQRAVWRRQDLKIDLEGWGNRPRVIEIGADTIAFDPDNRAQVVEVLSLLSDDVFAEARKTFREQLRDRKKEHDPDGSFSSFASEVQKRLKRIHGLPEPQTVYIGPFALDVDAMRAVRLEHASHMDAAIDALIDDMFRAVEIVRANLGLEPPTTFQEALEQEVRVEASVPAYAAFRDRYREVMSLSLMSGPTEGGDVLGTAPPAEDGVPSELEFIIAARSEPQTPPATAAHNERFNAIIADYPTFLKGAGDLGGAKRGRFSGSSRLAFRVNCPDGISQARAGTGGLDLPQDAAERLPPARLDFDMATLLSFRGMELAVTRRAELVYDPGQLGRLGWRAPRLVDGTRRGKLARLGFDLNGGATAAQRLAEVAGSLVPPGPFETAVEMPARLVLSPHQHAVVLTPSAPEPAIYDFALGDGCDALSGTLDETSTVAPFTASFVTKSDGLGLDPGLRAVWSPDLRPGVLLSRFGPASVREVDDEEPAAPIYREAAPPGGPIAPWHLARVRTEATGMSRGALDRLALANGWVAEGAPQGGVCDLAADPTEGRSLPQIVRDLCRAFVGRAEAPPSAMRFRNALSARDRHEIVLAQSAFGLPVIASGGDALALPEEDLRLVDVMPGYTSLHPGAMNVRVAALGALGGTLDHDSGLEPILAASFWADGRPIAPATSVERYRHLISRGRDVSVEVVYKGYLFPLGVRASLVKVTQREFYLDPHRGQVITVPLRQRLFIRIARPEKLYPAVKMPHEGRRFPVDRLTILTTQTPDLVDPYEGAAGGADPNPPGVTAPGRVVLDGGQGLIFWPRTLKTPLANVRFEMEIDGVKTTLPLIFADNTAVSNPTTMEALVAYYNDPVLVPSPDSAKQVALDPPRHLRTLDFGGADRRYAPEREAGSATYQTDHWTLRATGGFVAISPVSKGETTPVFDFDNGEHRFGPVRVGADQPPFYPAVEVARVHLTQTERLMGRVLGPKRAIFDARYVQHGFPPEESDASADAGDEADPASALVVPRDNPREVMLSLLDPENLDMGRKGDQSGGVFRPAGTVVALSRQKGALTLESFKAMDSDRIGTKDLLPDAAALFVTSEAAAKAVARAAPASGGALSLAPQQSEDDDLDAAIEEIRALYKKLFTCESKILGLVCLPDLIDLIQKFAPPAEGMPALKELKQFGEAAGEGADIVREEVVGRLAAAVRTVLQEWDEIDRDIAKQFRGAGLEERLIRVRDIFPDLYAALKALEKALSRAAGTTDPVLFALELSACHSAGQRFLTALKRAAANPIGAIEGAISDRFGDIFALFKALDGNLDGLAVAVVASAFGLEDVMDGVVVADDFEEVKGEVTARLVARVEEWLDAALAPVVANGAQILRRNMVGLPQPLVLAKADDEIDADALGCLAVLLPRGEDVRAVLSSFATDYAEAAVARAVEASALPDPGDALDAWLAADDAALFGPFRIGSEEIDWAAIGEDRIDEWFDALGQALPADLPAAALAALNDRLDALKARAERELLDAEGALRRGSRAQQIRARYVVTIVANLATDEDWFEECLPEVGWRYALDLFDALLGLLAPLDEVELRIRVDLRGLLAPIWRVLSSIADLLAAVLSADLDGLLAAALALLGELKLPLPGCDGIDAVWQTVRPVLVRIETVAGEVAFCPAGWTGPLPDAAADFVDQTEGIEAVPPGSEPSICAALLQAAVAAEGLRRGTAAGADAAEDALGAAAALRADLPAELETPELTAAFAKLEVVGNTATTQLVTVRDALVAAYGAVLRDGLALAAVQRDLAALTGLETACGSDPEAAKLVAALQAAATLPQNVRLLAERREAALKTMVAAMAAVVEALRVLADDEDGALAALAIVLAFAEEQGAFEADGATPSPPDWLTITDEQSAALAAAARRLQALAERVAEALCDIGRVAVGVIDEAEGIATDVRARIGALREQVATLPPQVQGVVARIEREVDIAGAEARLAEARQQADEIRAAIDVLCPAAAQGALPADGMPALSRLFPAGGDSPALAIADPAGPIEAVLRLGRDAMDRLLPVVDEIRAIVDEGPQRALLGILGPVLKVPLADGIDIGSTPFSDGDKLSVLSIYRAVLEGRKQLLGVAGAGSVFDLQALLVLPGPARGPLDSSRGPEDGYVPAASADDLTGETDRLAGDVAWLEAAAQGDLTPDEAALLMQFAREWGEGGATPILILSRAAGLVSDVFSGKVYEYIDFARLREEFEEQLLALVPTKVAMSYGFEMELGSEVAAATLGIFRPGPGTALGIDMQIEMDLAATARSGEPQVRFGSVGTLGQFDVKLVGDLFDAITLKFASARFESKGGEKARFDIDYIGHEIGPQLKFVQKLQKYLAPKDGSGAILNFDRAMPGVEAGYRLQLGAFAVGNLAFSNVGLESTAILPFNNRDAVFKASLSSRASPFTLTYAPYGGSGFFAIYANVEGIIGFEASFEFGGSAVFAIGPLTGEGRLMSGVYIKQTVIEGVKSTEIAMTVIAEGSASIWIFGFSTCLSLQMGQQDGNMTGRATFSFRFSLGLADYGYAVTFEKTEDEGFQGQQSHYSDGAVRFAQLGDEQGHSERHRHPSGALIERIAVCQSGDWPRYQSYFEDVPPPEGYF